MPFYSAVYQQKSQIDHALEKLAQNGIPDESIQIISDTNKHSSIFPSDYDPLGGARLAGTNMTTMAATGPNIIGNSTTIDVSLDILPELLSELVESENTENTIPDELQPSFLLIVETNEPAVVQHIVNETEGIMVDIDNFYEK